MNSDIPLKTAAMFFVADLYLKQGIGWLYIMVDFISMGLLDMWGSRTDNYKMKNSCPYWDLNQGSFASEANGSVLAKGCAISWDI